MHTVVTIRKYSFTDEKTGKPVSGMKVTYLDPAKETSDFRGSNAFTLNCEDSLWHKFDKVPGQYEIQFGQKMGQGGKPAIFIQDIQVLAGAKA